MKDIIKKELDRRFHDNMKAAEQFEEGSYPYIMFVSAAKEDYDLLAFIEDIEEEKEPEEANEEWSCVNPQVIDGTMLCDGYCDMCGWHQKEPILKIDE